MCEVSGNQYFKENRPIIICGGNLIARKGHKYFLKAAKEVLNSNQANFLIIGDGTERNHLKNYAKDLGLEGSVAFTGRLSWPDMYSIFTKDAALCVSPSLGELFPYYVLECMAAAKPIIATDVGGVSEAVVNGVNGLLVPPKDSSALAKAIVMLLDDQNKSNFMGQNSRRIIEEQFNLDTVVSQLTKCYEKIVVNCIN
jgi:L-malate glycosyltransferase